MVRCLYFSLFFLLTASFGLAQKKPIIDALNRIVFTKTDTTFQFYVVKPNKIIRVSPEKLYYWYKSEAIITTVGGFDGKLLNGIYKSFYSNRNLMTNGMFKMGIKYGIWKEWYQTGQLKSLVTWKNSKPDGLFKNYSESGILIKEGKYKNGLLNGKVIIYESDGKAKVFWYKEGKLLERKNVKK